MIKAVDVYSWAATAEVGDSVRYMEHDPYQERSPMFCRALGSAYNASLEGRVFLSQRRIERGFAYEATRISRPTALWLRLVDSSGRPVMA